MNDLTVATHLCHFVCQSTHEFPVKRVYCEVASAITVVCGAGKISPHTWLQ